MLPESSAHSPNLHRHGSPPEKTKGRGREEILPRPEEVWVSGVESKKPRCE